MHIGRTGSSFDSFFSFILLSSHPPIPAFCYPSTGYEAYQSSHISTLRPWQESPPLSADTDYASSSPATPWKAVSHRSGSTRYGHAPRSCPTIRVIRIFFAVCLAGYQTADTTDDQINLHPRFTRLIEFINHSRVLCVHSFSKWYVPLFRLSPYLFHKSIRLRNSGNRLNRATSRRLNFGSATSFTQHTEKRMQVIDNYFIQ